MKEDTCAAILFFSGLVALAICVGFIAQCEQSARHDYFEIQKLRIEKGLDK